ncbi:MAG: HdeD family acid-resistance protein [Desulfomonile sp.]|nr:HdeD family acid-resistance protein [Desulfomonile sp.]
MSAQAEASTGEAGATIFGALHKNWGWILVLGILFLVLGFVGLGSLFALTLASAFVFGILIIVGGVAQFLQALKCKEWKSVAFHVLIAILYVIGGVFVIQDPLAASVFLTWVLAAVLIGAGVLRIIMAFQMKSSGSWGVPLLGGIISVILGGIILAQWPLSGLFVIGLFVAVELIVSGWTYIFMAFAARKAQVIPA